jgi:hypothetical protein
MNMSFTDQDAINDNPRSHISGMSRRVDDPLQASNSGMFHCSLIEAIVVSVPWLQMQNHIMLFSQLLPAWRIALATYKAANDGQSLPRKAVFMGGRYRLLKALPMADAMTVVRDNLDESLRILSAESDPLARDLQLMRQHAAAVINDDDDDDDIGEAIQM